MPAPICLQVIGVIVLTGVQIHLYGGSRCARVLGKVQQTVKVTVGVSNEVVDDTWMWGDRFSASHVQLN